MSKGEEYPTPPNLKITQATLPVGVNLGAHPLRDNGCAGANQIERGYGKDHAKAGRIGQNW